MIPILKMVKEKSELKPILLKVGIALALSYATLIYSRYGSRRSKPASRLTPSPSSDHSEAAVAVQQKVKQIGDHALQNTSSPRRVVSNSEGDHEVEPQQTMTVDALAVGQIPSSEQGAEILLPEFYETGMELDFGDKSSPKYVKDAKSDADAPREFSSHEKDDKLEIQKLRDMVSLLRDRERMLEFQLLEYYGLKEQEATVMELQNRLEKTTMEGKMLSLKIESLQSENRRLEIQLEDHERVVSELDAAKAKIRMLKQKLRNLAEMGKEQIMILKEKVSQLQDKINAASYDEEIRIRLQSLNNDHKTEASELWEANLKLQEENSYLAQRLKDPEANPWQREKERLTQENEGLAKQSEQLQSDHCSDGEELVYLRWLNACLRYDLRHQEAAPGKTVARELSNSLSPMSEKKVKQLIVEYADGEGVEYGKRGCSLGFGSDRWSSSQASTITYSGELDYTSAGYCSDTKNSSSRKAKFFGKLRKLIRRKEASNCDSDRAKPGSVQESRSSFPIANDTEVKREGSTSSLQTLEGNDLHGRAMSMREESVVWKNSRDRRSDSIVTRLRRRSADFRRSLDTPSESSENSELLKYAKNLKVSSARHFI